MPLNIEQTDTDTPEVAALKAKVIEVARRYTARHGWCREVDRALEEAGVKTVAKMIDVVIDFTIAGLEPQTAHQKLNVTDLAGKTPDEQCAFVAELIAPTLNVAGTQVKFPVTVTDLNEYVRPAPPSLDEVTVERVYELGFNTGHTGTRGVVLHVTQPMAAGQFHRSSSLCDAFVDQRFSELEIALRVNKPICRNCARQVASGAHPVA